MVALTPGVAFETPENRIVVDAGLEPGKWQVQLVVIDNDRNESAPQLLTLKINDRPVAPPPTPGPTGPRIPGGVFNPGGVFTPRQPFPIDPGPIAPGRIATPARPSPIDPRIIIRRPPN